MIGQPDSEISVCVECEDDETRGKLQAGLSFECPNAEHIPSERIPINDVHCYSDDGASCPWRTRGSTGKMPVGHKRWRRGSGQLPCCEQDKGGTPTEITVEGTKYRKAVLKFKLKSSSEKSSMRLVLRQRDHEVHSDFFQMGNTTRRLALRCDFTPGGTAYALGVECARAAKRKRDKEVESSDEATKRRAMCSILRAGAEAAEEMENRAAQQLLGMKRQEA